ncbi:Aminomethyltransferase [Lacunisphaera limnophila]|uniref:Aminomethyltransferase n=1 Tax=Lacunisphaera limnophila TaxID=1838286 RepID=A0A1D8AXG3_9BACT|nr:glycine cleavage system aminomethyltransferase GcvT [Lacunisphaera limnophila]AOS45579.1 Aminomethyltransferase [Lacunisphaera limnophila]
MSVLQTTPLNAFHRRQGGRMVDFAGWDMPVQYRSILEEHKAVRQRAGLFDVSHMGEAEVKGPEALKFLQHLVSNDCSKLFPGRVLYTVMCYPHGGVVDDLLVYMRGPDDYFLCINAGNIAKDIAWMQEQVKGFACTVTDRSADYGQIAIQGPKAVAIVQALTSSDLSGIKYYHFADGEVAGVKCIISRTGYTGEDGVELYCAAGDVERLTEAVLAAGLPHGLELTALGARDSLRLEAGFPLYGHEITENINPLVAGLGWVVKFDKGPFIGSAALQAEKAKGLAKKIVFFRTGDRRIVRAGSPVLNAAGNEVGQVVSGTLSPILNEAIGSALIDAAAAQDLLMVDIRGTKLNLHLVKPPFVPLKKH